MSPTWQPVPALLSVRPCSCPTVALLPVRPKNFHNISAKQIARKNGNAIFGRLLRRPLPNGRHVASTHTYVSAPTHSQLHGCAVLCVLGPCSCNVCPIEFNNIFIWILVSREYFPAIFTSSSSNSSRKTATAPSVALAVALCASVTCPLKCFCHLWLKIGPELVSRANTTWCVLPCRNTAPNLK